MKQYAIEIKVYLDGDEVCSHTTITSPMIDNVIMDAEEQLGKIQSGIERREAKQILLNELEEI